jgi:succinyl-CoA synthetase beta subunit
MIFSPKNSQNTNRFLLVFALLVFVTTGAQIIEINPLRVTVQWEDMAGRMFSML